jgi:hypothetical protein
MNAYELNEIMEKLATGDTKEIPPPPQAEKEHSENTKVLEELFETRDGLAENSKKDLARYFPVGNPQYNMRQQTLCTKVASLLKKA